MHQNKKRTNDNIRAIAIGSIIIIAVAIIIFFKNYFFKKTANINLDTATESQVSIKDMRDYKSIKNQDLFDRINSAERIELIDIREESEFKISHLMGAKNITLARLTDEISTLDKDKEYVIIDNFGFTPIEIEFIDILSQNNFEKVYYLEGGITAWKNDLNPVVTLGDPYSLTDQSKVTYIKSDDLKNLIDAKSESLQIIDLRNKNSYSTGHLRGAVNIPLDELEKEKEKITIGKKIILYSDDGLFAFQGAVKLFDMGIFNILTLSDGLNTWKQKGFEIIK